MSIERLAAADQIMLWPDQVWPQDIGAIAVLDGSNLLDPDGHFRIEVVREAIARRLHLVPRFRQLLFVPPRKLGGPLWVDAPAFDLTDHVRVLPLPAPGDEAQLLLAVEQLRRRRLDKSRPLWEMWRNARYLAAIGMIWRSGSDHHQAQPAPGAALRWISAITSGHRLRSKRSVIFLISPSL